MFAKDEYVIYGTTGVCRITDIRKEKFSGNTRREYYILKPVYENNSVIYVPTDCDENKMRELMTVSETTELINNLPYYENVWIDDDNTRKEKYSGIIKKGDRKELIGLIKTLYIHKEERIESGRKFHNVDDKLLKEAEKLLFEEIAVVMDIEIDEVFSFISGEVK